MGSDVEVGMQDSAAEEGMQDSIVAALKLASGVAEETREQDSVVEVERRA